MDDIVLDKQLFADFCKHLSASLNSLDLVYKVRQLSSPKFDPNKDDPIVLAVFDQKMSARLTELKYPEFIQECVRNLQLTKNCADVFLSEVDQNTFELFEQGFEHLAPQATVERVDAGFVVHSPALIADLILPPIGRMHNEILKSFDHFSGVLRAVGGDPTRLFLNAKSPTPESQFVQMWVASKLNIPPAMEGGLIAVV